MTIPWPAARPEPNRPAVKKGVLFKLFGVVLIFLGALDTMMAWRGGFAVSATFVVLIAAGMFLFAVGAIKGRSEVNPSG